MHVLNRGPLTMRSDIRSEYVVGLSRMDGRFVTGPLHTSFGPGEVLMSSLVIVLTAVYVGGFVLLHWLLTRRN